MRAANDKLQTSTVYRLQVIMSQVAPFPYHSSIRVKETLVKHEEQAANGGAGNYFQDFSGRTYATIFWKLHVDGAFSSQHCQYPLHKGTSPLRFICSNHLPTVSFQNELCSQSAIDNMLAAGTCPHQWFQIYVTSCNFCFRSTVTIFAWVHLTNEQYICIRIYCICTCMYIMYHNVYVFFN